MKHQTNLDKVKEFHKAFDLALGEKPTEDSMGFRLSLIEEEMEEFEEEIKTYNDIGYGPEFKDTISPNMIKEMTDLLYVIYGTAVSFGIDLDTAFHRTHMSNMSKLGEDGKPIYREDGKVLKSKNYRKPNMDGLVPKHK